LVNCSSNKLLGDRVARQVTGRVAGMSQFPSLCVPIHHGWTIVLHVLQRSLVVVKHLFPKIRTIGRPYYYSLRLLYLFGPLPTDNTTDYPLFRLTALSGDTPTETICCVLLCLAVLYNQLSAVLHSACRYYNRLPALISV
jgi:hypothetical protein